MNDANVTIENHEIQEPRSLDQLKATYQTVIRSLLRQRGCEAISLPEFERFKHEARFSAFTCRLLSCPKSFVGFDNENALIQHESGHCVHICTFPGCQYPPFPSAANLRRHEKQQHEVLSLPVQKRTSIRLTKPGTRNIMGRVQISADARHGPNILRPAPLAEPRPWEERVEITDWEEETVEITDPEILTEVKKWDEEDQVSHPQPGLLEVGEALEISDLDPPRPSIPRPATIFRESPPSTVMANDAAESFFDTNATMPYPRFNGS